MTNDDRVRRLIAEEAARVILEEGLADYGAAKRKAAGRLDLAHTRNLPRNAEIESAVADRQRLFATPDDADHLAVLRRTAIHAMKQFAACSPRLVGSVLQGTATKWSDINLHVFADTPESVMFALVEAGIPFRNDEHRFKIAGNGNYETRPTLRFMAGEAEVELVIFPVNGIRQAPPGPVGGRPMQRADIREVETLLDRLQEGLAL